MTTTPGFSLFLIHVRFYGTIIIIIIVKNNNNASSFITYSDIPICTVLQFFKTPDLFI